MENAQEEKKQTGLLRALDSIERVGNAMPHPATLFIILSGVVMVASALCASANVAVTYSYYDSAAKAMGERTVAAVNLLSADGLRWMITHVVSNFTGFFALGTVFTCILGVSVAEGTGFMSAVLRKLASVTPGALLTPVCVFLGVMSNMASSTGYVVFVPLGAILFMSFRRHPIAGLAATFAGVSGGWSANLLLGSNDPIMAGISTQAANILDTGYNVLPTANWFFMIASTILITILGTLVTEKIVEPRLGAYEFADDASVSDVSDAEKRGMRWAFTALVIYIAVILIALLPQNSLLRNP